MRILSGDAVDAALDDLALVDRLEAMFRDGCEMPTRHHHTIAAANGPGSADATLLLMPAWTRGGQSSGGQSSGGGRVGIKVVTVFPDNGQRGLPAIYGQYLLLDGATGQPLAMLDGTVLTKRRTACASGLAARHLAPAGARKLLVIGTGALAPQLARVHARVRPIAEIMIWGRRPEAAATLARELADSLPRALGRAVTVRAVSDRATAVAEADIVSCATLSKEPLVEGRWLRPGQHLDLVGAFTPQMRESDDAAVQRARVYVDTRAGALKEGGDLVQPLQGGAIVPGHIVGDLHELARGTVAGRAAGDVSTITLFKSVGAALEDLAAAELAVMTAR